MTLTPQQSAALKTAILADPSVAEVFNSGDLSGAAAYMNEPHSPAFFVWRDTTPAADILDAITWASLTPADSPDGTATYTNRALMCQAKQLNLQIILQGRESVATGRLNVRQALTDALTGVPAGPGGTQLDAGWLGASKVKSAIQRQASRFERLFATGAGTSNTPAVMTVVGPLAYTDLIGL